MGYGVGREGKGGRGREGGRFVQLLELFPSTHKILGLTLSTT